MVKYQARRPSQHMLLLLAAEKKSVLSLLMVKAEVRTNFFGASKSIVHACVDFASCQRFLGTASFSEFTLFYSFIFFLLISMDIKENLYQSSENSCLFPHYLFQILNLCNYCIWISVRINPKKIITSVLTD